MKRYRTLLLDADGTLLDFERSARIALLNAGRAMGVSLTDADYERYHELNEACWRALERGEMTKAELLAARFRLFFADRGLALDPDEMNRRYMDELAGRSELIEGARELLAALSPHYELAVISNGVARILHGRLQNAGIEGYFAAVIASETAGFEKPARGFLDYALAQLPGRERESMLVLGDSLSSDMRGALDYGLDCCWLNAAGQPRPAWPITMEVRSLSEFVALMMPKEEN